MDCPFAGSILFEAKIRVLGVAAKRVLRANYEYTPPWPFFDPETATEVSAPSKLVLDLEAWVRPGTPEAREENGANWLSAPFLLWTRALSPRVVDKLEELIDNEARIQDRERRRAVQAPDPPPADDLPDII
jgi:hypothetical protein